MNSLILTLAHTKGTSIQKYTMVTIIMLGGNWQSVRVLLVLVGDRISTCWAYLSLKVRNSTKRGTSPACITSLIGGFLSLDNTFLTAVVAASSLSGSRLAKPSMICSMLNAGCYKNNRVPGISLV